MTTVLLVGVGGFIGSALRYLINKEVQQLLIAPNGFPYGVLLVNVVGCLVIGILSGLATTHGIFNLSSGSRAFLFLGLLGGFTTFSAFGYDTVTLAKDGDFTQAIANLGLQIGLGLGAVWIGYKLAVW
jgi:CrcB protein